MRWFTSVSVGVFASAASLFWAPMAYACPLCFASAGPGVVHAYLVSAFFMIGLAWAVIGGIWLYAARMHSQSVQPEDSTVNAKVSRSIRGVDGDFDRRIAAGEIVPEEARGKS